jgi:hypothetical protein
MKVSATFQPFASSRLDFRELQFVMVAATIRLLVLWTQAGVGSARTLLLGDVLFLMKPDAQLRIGVSHEVRQRSVEKSS